MDGKERIAKATGKLTEWMGSTTAIIGSFVIILVWASVGPFFRFSDTWQLVVNTGTTILTFNMVFVIQCSQNRDARAIHVKLDALIHATPGAEDRLMGLEEAPLGSIKQVQSEVRGQS